MVSLGFSKMAKTGHYVSLCQKLKMPKTCQKPFYNNSTVVVSGVPQGTVLGPILFLIYINHITRNVESQSKLFADDMKVYKALRNVHEDTQILQDYLNVLEQWSTDWQLSFKSSYL